MFINTSIIYNMKQIVSLSKNKFTLLVALLFSVGVFLTFHFGVMAWQTPDNNPPTGNTPAPINVGPNVNNVGQIKDGDIGAARFGSDLYCDASFQECYPPGAGGISMGGLSYIDWHGRGQTVRLCPVGTVMVGTSADWTSSRGISNIRPVCIEIIGINSHEISGEWRAGSIYYDTDPIIPSCLLAQDTYTLCTWEAREVWCEYEGMVVQDGYCDSSMKPWSVRNVSCVETECPIGRG